MRRQFRLRVHSQWRRASPGQLSNTGAFAPPNVGLAAEIFMRSPASNGCELPVTYGRSWAAARTASVIAFSRVQVVAPRGLLQRLAEEPNLSCPRALPVAC
jgi:hypothetical protein